jgi:hypothetical protein
MKTIIISVCAAILIISSIGFLIRALLSAPLLSEGEEDWNDWRLQHNALDKN